MIKRAEVEIRFREMIEILKPLGPKVTVWQTGGGCMNPVIILEENAEGQGVRYVMFGVAWGREEASFGYYDEVTNPEDLWDSAVIDWSASGDDVPMDPEGIRQLVRSVVGPHRLEEATKA